MAGSFVPIAYDTRPDRRRTKLHHRACLARAGDAARDGRDRGPGAGPRWTIKNGHPGGERRCPRCSFLGRSEPRKVCAYSTFAYPKRTYRARDLHALESQRPSNNGHPPGFWVPRDARFLRNRLKSARAGCRVPVIVTLRSDEDEFRMTECVEVP